MPKVILLILYTFPYDGFMFSIIFLKGETTTMRVSSFTKSSSFTTKTILKNMESVPIPQAMASAETEL